MFFPKNVNFMSTKKASRKYYHLLVHASTEYVFSLIWPLLWRCLRSLWTWKYRNPFDFINYTISKTSRPVKIVWVVMPDHINRPELLHGSGNLINLLTGLSWLTDIHITSYISHAILSYASFLKISTDCVSPYPCIHSNLYRHSYYVILCFVL